MFPPGTLSKIFPFDRVIGELMNRSMFSKIINKCVIDKCQIFFVNVIFFFCYSSFYSILRVSV